MLSPQQADTTHSQFTTMGSRSMLVLQTVSS
ncbi:mCG148304 [Mus musculus]|nr:mCG148304 [Mus musculus]